MLLFVVVVDGCQWVMIKAIRVHIRGVRPYQPKNVAHMYAALTLACKYPYDMLPPLAG
jgi:hypothetical protein